jgi:serine/threonine protein kinase
MARREDQPAIHFPAGFGIEDLVSFGQVGLVFLDKESNTVIKLPFSYRDPDHHLSVQREQAVYERLARKGGHEGVLAYHGSSGMGIRLEYAPNQLLRGMLETDRTLPIEIRFNHVQRLRWAIQITNALAFIHSAGVIHGDLTCRNILLDANFNTKVFDFAGSSIDGSPFLMDIFDENHRCPNQTRVSVQADLFALGCVMYEIMTGPPHDGVEAMEVRALYSKGSFPPTNHLGGIGCTIEGCWRGGYLDAAEIAAELEGMHLGLAYLWVKLTWSRPPHCSNSFRNGVSAF